MAGCGDEVDAGLLPRIAGGLDLDLRSDDPLECGPNGLRVRYDTASVALSPTGELSARRRRQGATVGIAAAAGVAANTELVLTYQGPPTFDSGDGMWDGTYLVPAGATTRPVAIQATIVLATPMTATLLCIFRWRGGPSLFPIVNYPVRAFGGAAGVGNGFVGASWVGPMFPGSRLQIVLYGAAAIPAVLSTGSRVSMMRMGG